MSTNRQNYYCNRCNDKIQLKEHCCYSSWMLIKSHCCLFGNLWSPFSLFFWDHTESKWNLPKLYWKYHSENQLLQKFELLSLARNSFHIFVGNVKFTQILLCNVTVWNSDFNYVFHIIRISSMYTIGLTRSTNWFSEKLDCIWSYNPT